MKWIRKHASFANVTSLMALTVALGGTAYAGATLTRNSVGTGQLKRGAVANSDIRNNAVTSAKVRNGSLRAADFARGVLNTAASTTPGPRGLTGAQGPAGPAGPAGADGAPGQNGTADAFARVAATGTLQPNVTNFPSQVKGTILVSKGEGGAATGTYCFDLPSRPASALVSLDNADAAVADRNLVTSVAIDRGEDLGDCPANRNDARVRIVDGNTEAAQDARFFIWFEL